MLFCENPAIASECFGKPVGKLIPGALADIIVVDYDPPTPFTAVNLNSHIQFGFSGEAVITTIISGRVVMHRRELITIDEKEVMAKSRGAAAELWNRI
jgi:cytosine/adenosine deaminase-related metal-dependent hydrolase